MSWFTAQRTHTLTEMAEQQENIASRSTESLEAEADNEQEYVEGVDTYSPQLDHLREVMQEDLLEVQIS